MFVFVGAWRSVGGRVTGAPRLERGLRRKKGNLENIVSSCGFGSLALVLVWLVGEEI
jgi:hypothetical protein